MGILAAFLEIVGLLGFTWWLLGQYSDKHVTLVVHGAVFLSWVLGFLGLLLLPTDLTRNGFVRLTDDVGHDAPNASRTTYLLGWQVLYWLTFLLSWVVLPFLAEFVQNGEFELTKRIRSSLQQLIFHWTIVAGVAGIALMYLVFVGHFSMYGLIGLAMASANTYGLLWLISLLGYGLANIPRSLWILRFPENRLKELYFRAVQVHDERMEAIFEYEEVVASVEDCYARILHSESASIILTSEMQFVKACILQVRALVQHQDDRLEEGGAAVAGATYVATSSRKRNGGKRSGSVFSSSYTSSKSTQPPSLREVVELHRQARLTKSEMRRCEQTWLELCIHTETLQDRVSQRDLPPACLYPPTTALNRIRNLLLTSRYRLFRVTTAPFWIACAVITGFASLCILWGELTMGIDASSSSISLFRVFTEKYGISAAEMLAFIVLLYLVICSYSSLFTLRMFGKFALRSHHNSTELALLKTSTYQCRLQFALGYNFLLLLHDRNVTNRTAFHALLENMQIVHVFGRDFSIYAPILMVLLVAFTLGNGYAYIMQHLGLDQYEHVIFGHPDHENIINKGEQLVQKGVERYRTVISRRKKQNENASRVYGYPVSHTDPVTQALLLDNDHDEEGVAIGTVTAL